MFKKVISAFTLCFTVLRYEGIHRGQLALVQVNNTVLCYDKNGNPNSIGQLREQGGALVDEEGRMVVNSSDLNRN